MFAMQKLERCEICMGKGSFLGVFHRMECAGCNGGGFVTPDGQPLEYPALVQQLRLRLAMSGSERRMMQAALEKAGLWPLAGPGDDYAGRNNRRGAGGSHYTGD
ncbi:hypothetical protein [Pseudomonas sp. BN414]|uniref:hypothetical protein n=1 Tax=Pseudomonas sp. BN414 TaxID=2567888 RepID=UPI002455B10F|nr:hypothetical protein [Pseudomonas sp. BN414]